MPNALSQEFTEYLAALQRHDWHYDYSDDYRVWRNGRENEKQLLAQADSDAHYYAAYLICKRHYFDGKCSRIQMQATLGVIQEELEKSHAQPA